VTEAGVIIRHEIYELIITQQGIVYDSRYFYSRKAAEKERDADHHQYLKRYLIRANRTKGAIRGRGQADIDRLAHGFIAEARTYTITRHHIRGGLEEESE
jgi:hypothetical protein